VSRTQIIYSVCHGRERRFDLDGAMTAARRAFSLTFSITQGDAVYDVARCRPLLDAAAWSHPGELAGETPSRRWLAG
jgi:hypothetical protein